MDTYSEQQIDRLLTDSPSMMYTGSRLLEPLCKRVGLQVDQINVVVAIITSVMLGWCYRHWLHPSRVSVEARQAAELIGGLVIVNFVYGHVAWHLLAQTLLCLVIMLSVSGRTMAHLVMIAAMGYLAGIHIYRMMYRYLDTSIYIDGTLMISTTKLTALAWGIVDGQEDQGKLHPHLQRHALSTQPSVLASLSYVINFHSTLIGPFCFFDDYIANVTGKNLQDDPALGQQGWKRLSEVALLLLIMASVYPRFPPEHLLHLSPEMNWFVRLMVVVWYVEVHRFHHYLVFKMATASANSAGLAFNGYDANDKPRWDLMENIKIMDIEWPKDLRSMINAWHISATHWLRYVAYYRLPKARTALTFVTSILWHGFYPGYFLAGLQMMFFLPAARLLNKSKRNNNDIDVKQNGYRTELPKPNVMYDVCKKVMLVMITNYCMLPFVLLGFYSTIQVYSSVYFAVNTVAAVLVLVIWIKRKLEWKGHEKTA